MWGTQFETRFGSSRRAATQFNSHDWRDFDMATPYDDVDLFIELMRLVLEQTTEGRVHFPTRDLNAILSE